MAIITTSISAPGTILRQEIPSFINGGSTVFNSLRYTVGTVEGSSSTTDKLIYGGSV